MPAPLRYLLRPLTARTTYLRWLHLVLGAVLAIPFTAIGTVAGILLSSGMLGFRWPALAVNAAEVLLITTLVTATACFPLLRRMEQFSARELLHAAVGEDFAPYSWATRMRTAGWLAARLVLGGAIGFLTLAVAPVILVLWVSPVLPSTRIDLMHPMIHTVFGFGTWQAPLWGTAMFLAGYHLVWGSGALLTRLAPVLLGPSSRDRLVAAQRQVRDLAARNQLASDLHDSVGHALSVITLQASAAARVFDSDPDFAKTALNTIEESTRAALDDLDHVLGVLRQDRGDAAPTGTLGEVSRLIASTEAAGLTVDAELGLDLDTLPAPVSREAYRIVREGLTNALRHAGKVPVALRLAQDSDVLTMEITNPLRERPPPHPRQSAGLGISGIEQRVEAIGGRVSAGAQDGHWCLAVTIPLGSEGERARS